MKAVTNACRLLLCTTSYYFDLVTSLSAMCIQGTGELLAFNGYACEHFNRLNTTERTRVSIDFRMISMRDFLENNDTSVVTRTNPERKALSFRLGSYYSLLPLGENIMQMRPSTDEQEASAVSAYMRSGGFLTEFTHTRKFEEALSSVIGTAYCSVVPNGTVAITAALLACGLDKHSCVLVPTLSMVATANAVRLMGAEVVFVDVDPETYTITPDIVRGVLDSGVAVDAVIHVSLNNRCKDLEGLARLCKSRKIWLIEDAAQSLGAQHNYQSIGTFGDIATFSFSAPKIITTGQGGCVVTNSPELGARLKRIRNFGRDRAGVEDYPSFGVNFKFTDVQSVIGLVQLSKLSGRVQKMKRMWKLYE